MAVVVCQIILFHIVCFVAAATSPYVGVVARRVKRLLRHSTQSGSAGLHDPVGGGAIVVVAVGADVGPGGTLVRVAVGFAEIVVAVAVGTGGAGGV